MNKLLARLLHLTEEPPGLLPRRPNLQLRYLKVMWAAGSWRPPCGIEHSVHLIPRERSVLVFLCSEGVAALPVNLSVVMGPAPTRRQVWRALDLAAEEWEPVSQAAVERRMGRFEIRKPGSRKMDCSGGET